jgi:hypothetical protein
MGCCLISIYPYLFYFKITSQFLPVCSAQYMGSKLTKFKFRVCSWTNFDICLISFYFISIYCYDCLNKNLLIHFFSILVACHYVLILDLLLKKLWGRDEISQDMFTLYKPLCVPVNFCVPLSIFNYFLFIVFLCFYIL